MKRHQPTTDSIPALQARELAGARLLFVDSDSERLALNRQWLEQLGGPDAETASLGDEALDVLGAKAQQVDIVALWLWLADHETVDFTGILRRCRSPVRLVAVTSLTQAELGGAGRLAGAAAVADSGELHGLIDTLATVYSGRDTVDAIVSRHRVPASLQRDWAWAIYGTFPGQHFHADLD